MLCLAREKPSPGFVWRRSFNEPLTVEQLTVGNLQLIGQPEGALAAKTSAALNIPKKKGR